MYEWWRPRLYKELAEDYWSHYCQSSTHKWDGPNPTNTTPNENRQETRPSPPHPNDDPHRYATAANVDVRNAHMQNHWIHWRYRPIRANHHRPWQSIYPSMK